MGSIRHRLSSVPGVLHSQPCSYLGQVVLGREIVVSKATGEKPYEPKWEVDGEVRREIRAQIGALVVLSVSGGRVTAIKDGIELPVSNGFRVRVHLTPADEYVVERVFTRAGKEFQHGQMDAMCDTVSEAAYYAGMFRSYDADAWPSKVG